MGKWEIHGKYKELVGTVINISQYQKIPLINTKAVKVMRLKKKKKSLNIQYLNRKTLVNKRMVCFMEL